MRLRHTTGSKRSTYKEIFLVGLTIVGFIIILQVGSIISAPFEFSSWDKDDTTPSSQSTAQVRQKINGENNSSHLSENNQQGIPVQAPLTIESTHEDVWRRILSSRYTWETLWVDVSVILLGPADYIGPPLVERHQLWLTQEQDGFHISGISGSEQINMERITANSTGPGNLSLLYGVDDFSRLGSQISWFYMSSDTITTVPYMANFFFIADYDFPPRRLNFRVVEESVWAERPVVVVDVTDRNGILQANLWLDAFTGLALREHFFAGDETQHVRLETIVDRVEYNQTFQERLPQKLFAENKQVIFAADSSGNPVIQDHVPNLSIWQALSSRAAPPAMYPPEDFDPRDSRLSFVLPEPDSDPSPGRDQVQLYADEYLLGEIFIDDPWHSICARSMDGRQVVISQWSQPPDKLVSTIGLYDLSNLQPNIIRIPGVTITRMVYSPDNTQIAAAGVDQRSGLSQLYLINVETGRSELIKGFNNTWSLAWNPDGSQIAGLNLPSFRIFTPWKIRIQVYNIKSKEITSTTIEDNFRWGYSAAYIPLNGGIADFPLTMHGLEPCADPPAPDFPPKHGN